MNTSSSGRSLRSRKMIQPMPGYTSPNLCPEALIERTCSRRKSHSESGYRNGHTNAPLAPSTCSGTSSPLSFFSSTRKSLIPTTSSACPVNVVPTTAATPIVFSSTCGSTSAGPIVYLPSWSGTIRGSTSK